MRRDGCWLLVLEVGGGSDQILVTSADVSHFISAYIRHFSSFLVSVVVYFELLQEEEEEDTRAIDLCSMLL